MRLVLVTGLGGAGRTTAAAATALAAAARGERVLLLTGAPDALPGTALTSRPAHPADTASGLRAALVDPAADFRTEFLALQDRAGALLDLLGATRLTGEELTELPGSEESALLRAVSRAAAGEWDLIVADLPPLPAALRLLALPERLRRYLRRLLPPERQAARALRPVLAQLAAVPMPAQWLYESATRIDTELAAVQELIAAPGTAVRLVAEPGPAAARALRAARTGLALHGLRAEALLANRVLPRHSADPWLAGLAAGQEKCLHEWYEEWGTADPAALLPATPVHELPHLGREPEDTGDLARLGVPAPADPGGPGAGPVIEDLRESEGILVWALPLPGAGKEGLGLVRKGDELLLDTGPFRRILPLPPALRRCTVSGAALAGGVLRVRFTPDPGLWPEGR
jgi:arsenite/tail-anchored protein-transporting ATPase